jgi:hypothetical protein
MRACVLVATEKKGSCQSKHCTSQNQCWACRCEGRNLMLIPYLGSCLGHGENVNAGTLLCFLILCPPNLTNTSLPLKQVVWLALLKRMSFRTKMHKTSSHTSTYQCVGSAHAGNLSSRRTKSVSHMISCCLW